MQHQNKFLQMDVANGALVSSWQNKEAANGSPDQEGVPENSSEGQNKEFSIQASATEGNTTGTLNDNINNEEGINPASPNTAEESKVLAQTKSNPSQKNRIRKWRVRPPRYFEPQLQGGISINRRNRRLKKKTKLCFICGCFGHEGKRCKQVRGCFKCNTKGHLAIDCPDKNTGVDFASQVCLKCGSSGHDMFSCANEYDSDDLKAVQCYVCKKFGHLCCVENRTEKPAASCYNCGQLGHFGSGCNPVNNVANDLQQSFSSPKSGEGTAANIHTEKEPAIDKCGKRKKSKKNRKRKKIKPTQIDCPSHGRINPPPIPTVVGPHHGKPGSSILLPPEAAAAIASPQQHINHLSGTEVGNLCYPTARPPHLSCNSGRGGQNPQLPYKKYRQHRSTGFRVRRGEAEIPSLFYRLSQPPHIPQHPWSDPGVTQNSSNLSNQLRHLNQNATPTPVVQTPIPRPLNRQTGICLPHQNFHPQPLPLPLPLLSHQDNNSWIGSNVPRTQVPHPLNYQYGLHLPYEFVHNEQPPTLLSQTRSNATRTQFPQLLNRQSGFLPHQNAHRQPIGLLPHQNSDDHTRSIARTQNHYLLNPQTRILPHQIAHSQSAALLPHHNSYSQTGCDVARTQIPHPLNRRTSQKHWRASQFKGKTRMNT